MKRATKRERAALDDVYADVASLTGNLPRRRRNALRVLVAEDPRWMMWIEREIDPGWPLPRQTRLIEARARALVLRHHSFFGCKQIGDLLFSEHTLFTDYGSMLAG